MSLTVSLFAVPAWSAPSLTEVLGTVQIRKAGTTSWGAVTPNHIVASGDELRTGRGSRCVVMFDDGSKVEIGPNGSFTLEDAKPETASMKMNLGFMKAWVTKALSRRFQVRTPTAVCSVRGTEFGVDVRADGGTSVELFTGVVGVADSKGNEVLLNPGEKVDVTQGGLGAVQAQGASTGGDSGTDKARAALKREVGLEMTKEEVQAAAALEQKAAMYQQGKALIDVFGNRVRVEEYIIRPRPDQFKLVVLNERVDRFDYFYYLGTFNKATPDDLSAALKQIQGQAIQAPEYFLTSYETGRSNTIDAVLERAGGGHLVDVNNNGVAADDVTLAFDARVDGVVRLNVPVPGGAAGNDPFWKALYQTYNLTFNGVSHHLWNPAGAAPAYNAVTFAGGVQNYTTHIAAVDVTNVIKPPNCDDNERCTHTPEPGTLKSFIYLQNATGTVWEKFDTYVISDEGKVGKDSDFAGATTGAEFKRVLLNWNFQQVITASEFNGRKIDLVVAPKILIQSGLIP